MTDVWVVDASPLIILGQVGKLDWFEQLSSRFVVPDAVADEVLSGPEDPAHRALLSAWGERQRATVPESVGLDRMAETLVEYKNPRELALGSGKSTRYTYYTGSGQENLDHNLRCVILPEGGRDPGDVEPLCGPADQGHTWTHFVYYANDTAYEQTSSLGEVTHLYYDFFRRRTEVVFPDAAKEAYLFDRVGNIVRMETGRGVVHSYEYEDGTRNRTHGLDGFGRATTATYDAFGRMQRIHPVNPPPPRRTRPTAAG